MNPKLKNRISIAVIVSANTFGNLLLGIGMQRMPDFQAAGILGYIAALLTNLWIIFGVGLLILWMVSQLSMFTWADLTYVLPVTASAYILTAILAKFVLDERISMLRWMGIAVITIGVMFVSATPPRTVGKTEGIRS